MRICRRSALSPDTQPSPGACAWSTSISLPRVGALCQAPGDDSNEGEVPQADPPTERVARAETCPAGRTASNTRSRSGKNLGAQNTLTHPGFEPDLSSLVHVNTLMWLPSGRIGRGQQIHGAVGFGHVVDDIAPLARSRPAGSDAAGV